MSEPLRAALVQSALSDESKRTLLRPIDELARWLERMERSILHNRNTEEHKESVRKSRWYRQSGLTAAELEIKTKLATPEKEKQKS